MIHFKGVSKSFSKNRLLFENVNFSIPSGSRVAIFGKSGSGKSTLLKLIAGFESPTKGDIEVNGTIIWSPTINLAMHPQITLKQSLRFLVRLYTCNDIELDRVVEEILRLSGLKRKQNMLWRHFQEKDKRLLRASILCTLNSDCLLIDGALVPSGLDKEFMRRIHRRIHLSTTIMTSGEKIMKKYCNSALVIFNKKIEYFDDFNEAHKFYKSISKNG